MQKQSLTIGARLYSSFGALIVLNVVIGALALYTIGAMGDSLKLTVERSAKKLELNGEISKNIMGARTAQRGEVLFGLLKNPSQMAQNREQFGRTSETISKQITELSGLVDTAGGRAAVEQLRANLAAWQTHHQELLSMADQGKFEDAGRLLLEKTMVDAQAMQDSSDQLLNTLKGILAGAEAEAEASTRRSVWSFALAMALALGIGAVVIGLVRGINAKLKQISSAMEAGSAEVASAAGQVASSSQSLAQGASEQAASLEETSASGEEITSMTRQNADNSRSAAECMAEVDERVGETNRTLQEMETSMAEINASSDKIARIIKVIDEIAFQTNILALNAAVEAARAGEAGMGFAVVADEVRNLAQRSAQAAKDTAGLIEESIANSQEGSSKLSRVATAIESITASAVKVKTLIDQVNMGSQEQARGIEQISKAISQMEHVTQRNAASAEESASAAQEMTAQAERMKSFVVEMQNLVGTGAVSKASVFPGGRGEPGSLRQGVGLRKEVKTAGSRLNQSQPPKAGNSGRAGYGSGLTATRPAQRPEAQPRPAATITANDFPMDEEFTEF